MDGGNSVLSLAANGGGRRRSFEQRVRQAVASLQAEGKVPSFYQVAQRAKVARSTLYRNSVLREIVCKGRDEASARGPTDAWRGTPCSFFVYELCLLEDAA